MRTSAHDTRPAPAPGLDDGVPRRPYRPAGPSTKFAVIVLGITGTLFLAGILVQWLDSGSPPPPPSSTVRQAKGSPLTAVAGQPMIKPLIVGGQPPGDVVDAVVVPKGATTVARSSRDLGVETYDRSVEVRAHASEAALVTFFHLELAAEGWSSLSQGPPARAENAPAGSIEVLGKRGASDGNFWEIGAVVSPTTFPAGGAETTVVTLRLFVVSDSD
jgi:hypothetical protein